MKNHTITVTEVVDDDVSWESICPGNYELWVSCPICFKSDRTVSEAEEILDQEEEGFTRHGVHHFLRDGFVAVEQTGCALTVFDSAKNNVDTVLYEHDELRVPGTTFEVELDFDEDYVYVTLIEEKK